MENEVAIPAWRGSRSSVYELDFAEPLLMFWRECHIPSASRSHLVAAALLTSKLLKFHNILRRTLFPDNLGDFSEMLPILDRGEALVVGDASLLPSRVRIDKPSIPPNSATVDFWDEWGKEKEIRGIEQAVEALRKQQK